VGGHDERRRETARQRLVGALFAYQRGLSEMNGADTGIP
jgi:hypothetical protein